MSTTRNETSTGMTEPARRPKPKGWTAIGPPLLQELRVTQTGVQLLTGFLLTLPFQQRFDRLDDLMRGVYAATVACSVAATLALVAPVAMHRVLFRQHRLKTLVSAAHRLAYAGLVLLGLALVGVTLVVFDVVYGRGAAAVAGAVALGGFAALWVTLPLLMRRFGEASQTPSR